MVQVGNKPILWHILKIYSHYGFNDFIISCGVKSHLIKDYFANYKSYNDDFVIDIGTQEIQYLNNHIEKDWKLTLVDTGLNTLKGARIKRVEKYLDPGVNMVTYGDGVGNVDIRRLLEFHNSHGKMITITGVHPPARFGEIFEEDGQVLSFQEKPQTSVGLINGGFMVFNPGLLNFLTTDEKCDFEFGVLEKLVRDREVMVYKHAGEWGCVDHVRDLVHLNSLWNSNTAFWKVW